MPPEKIADRGPRHTFGASLLEGPQNVVRYRITERVSENMGRGCLAVFPDSKGGL
jgi:hypothetical protein